MINMGAPRREVRHPAKIETAEWVVKKKGLIQDRQYNLPHTELH